MFKYFFCCRLLPREGAPCRESRTQIAEGRGGSELTAADQPADLRGLVPTAIPSFGDGLGPFTASSAVDCEAGGPKTHRLEAIPSAHCTPRNAFKGFKTSQDRKASHQSRQATAAASPSAVAGRAWLESDSLRLRAHPSNALQGAPVIDGTETPRLSSRTGASSHGPTATPAAAPSSSGDLVTPSPSYSPATPLPAPSVALNTASPSTAAPALLPAAPALLPPPPAPPRHTLSAITTATATVAAAATATQAPPSAARRSHLAGAPAALLSTASTTMSLQPFSSASLSPGGPACQDAGTAVPAATTAAITQGPEPGPSGDAPVSPAPEVPRLIPLYGGFRSLGRSGGGGASGSRTQSDGGRLLHVVGPAPCEAGTAMDSTDSFSRSPSCQSLASGLAARSASAVAVGATRQQRSGEDVEDVVEEDEEEEEEVSGYQEGSVSEPGLSSMQHALGAAGRSVTRPSAHQLTTASTELFTASGAFSIVRPYSTRALYGIAGGGGGVAASSPRRRHHASSAAGTAASSPAVLTSPGRRAAAVVAGRLMEGPVRDLAPTANSAAPNAAPATDEGAPSRSSEAAAGPSATNLVGCTSAAALSSRKSASKSKSNSGARVRPHNRTKDSRKYSAVASAPRPRVTLSAALALERSPAMAPPDATVGLLSSSTISPQSPPRRSSGSPDSPSQQARRGQHESRAVAAPARPSVAAGEAALAPPAQRVPQQPAQPIPRPTSNALQRWKSADLSLGSADLSLGSAYIHLASTDLPRQSAEHAGMSPAATGAPAPVQFPGVRRQCMDGSGADSRLAGAPAPALARCEAYAPEPQEPRAAQRPRNQQQQLQQPKWALPAQHIQQRQPLPMAQPDPRRSPLQQQSPQGGRQRSRLAAQSPEPPRSRLDETGRHEEREAQAPHSKPASQVAMLQMLHFGSLSGRVPLNHLATLNVSRLSREIRALHWIGQGGGGAVFQGVWQGAPVAVKFMLAARPEHVDATALEAIVSLAVGHPNLVTTYAFDVTRLTDRSFLELEPRRPAHPHPHQHPHQQYYCASPYSGTGLLSTGDHSATALYNALMESAAALEPALHGAGAGAAGAAGGWAAQLRHHHPAHLHQHHHQQQSRQFPHAVEQQQQQQQQQQHGSAAAGSRGLAATHGGGQGGDPRAQAPACWCASLGGPTQDDSPPPFHSAEGFGEPDPASNRSAWSVRQVLTYLNAQPGLFLTHIIMEYCDFGSLQAAIQRGVFRADNGEEQEGAGSGSGPAGRGAPEAPRKTQRVVLRALLRTAREVAQGMSHLHANGIIHGDLKPGNVLLRGCRTDRRGFTALVSDFGLSKITRGDKPLELNHWSTVTVMAPEVIMGRWLKASDVFSFGILLWQLVTGEMMPYGNCTVRQVLIGVSQGVLKPEWPASCHPALSRLGRACLATSPQKRPSFEAIVKILTKIEQNVRNELRAFRYALATGPWAQQ